MICMHLVAQVSNSWTTEQLEKRAITSSGKLCTAIWGKPEDSKRQKHGFQVGKRLLKISLIAPSLTQLHRKYCLYHSIMQVAHIIRVSSSQQWRYFPPSKCSAGLFTFSRAFRGENAANGSQDILIWLVHRNAKNGSPASCMHKSQ